MQLLLDYSAGDIASWRRDFDAQAEMRGAASLSLLQIWLEEDAPGRVLCLFQYGDRARVLDWLKTEQALRGAGTPRFLKVAIS